MCLRNGGQTFPAMEPFGARNTARRMIAAKAGVGVSVIAMLREMGSRGDVGGTRPLIHPPE